MTTADILLQQAATQPDKLAVVDGAVSLTYSSLAEEVLRAAGGLLEIGVDRGDRVAIWAENRHEWIVAALAAQAAGAAVVPLNTRFKSAEAEDILRRSSARVVVASRGFLGNDYVDTVVALATGLPELRAVVALDGPGEGLVRPWSELRSADVPRDDVLDRVLSLTDDDVSDILFTSGTTGRPKGAVATHGVVLRGYRQLCNVVGLRPDDRYLILNPFFHAFGYKAGWLSCLLTGATAYPTPMNDARTLIDLIRRHEITVFPGPPTVYWSMMEPGVVTDRSDLDTLRLSITGSTSVPGELIRRMRTELTFRDILVGFGLTEANGLGTMCHPGDGDDVITGTSGRPVPGMELRIADGGEICLRGHLMSHYLDDPAATAAAIDPDGWLHTGDIGLLDADGNLVVTDRMKDMYIVGGFNAYPAEIENVLLQHPGITQVAVIGTPDERLGEVGVAFVIPTPGVENDPAEIIAWSRHRMANYKVPRHVLFRDELPLTANGKVLKTRLRELAGRELVELRGSPT